MGDRGPNAFALNIPDDCESLMDLTNKVYYSIMKAFSLNPYGAKSPSFCSKGMTTSYVFDEFNVSVMWQSGTDTITCDIRNEKGGRGFNYTSPLESAIALFCEDTNQSDESKGYGAAFVKFFLGQCIEGVEVDQEISNMLEDNEVLSSPFSNAAAYKCVKNKDIKKFSITRHSRFFSIYVETTAGGIEFRLYDPSLSKEVKWRRNLSCIFTPFKDMNINMTYNYRV